VTTFDHNNAAILYSYSKTHISRTPYIHDDTHNQPIINLTTPAGRTLPDFRILLMSLLKLLRSLSLCTWRRVTFGSQNQLVAMQRINIQTIEICQHIHKCSFVTVCTVSKSWNSDGTCRMRYTSTLVQLTRVRCFTSV